MSTFLSGSSSHALIACDKCRRPFLDQAQAAEYEARAKQQEEAQQKQIAGLLAQARSEERAASDARDNAEIRRLNTVIVQQNEAVDDKIRQAVETGMAAERLAMTSAMATHQAELDRLRRENGRMTRLLDERKPTAVGKIAEFDLAAVLKAASPEDESAAVPRAPTPCKESATRVSWSARSCGNPRTSPAGRRATRRSSLTTR
jgi:hypothetical protein